MPKIVIVGAGFGGMAVAKSLNTAVAEVVLVDRANHHLFQPLLYQVATAALSPSDVATANRTLLRGRGVRILNAEVTGVDPEGGNVLLADCGPERFDYLILATGAAYSLFGHEDWGRHVLVLKSLADAIAMRDHLLGRFEEAARSADADLIRRLLTFVVVGGGPTGVELSGTIAELARSLLPRDYPSIDPTAARIVLCEAGERLLSSFTPKQSAYALRALRSLGVDVRLGLAVDDIGTHRVDIGGRKISACTILWCAGTKARPAARWLNAAAAGNGGVIVESDCSVKGHPRIFAIGDVSIYTDTSGCRLPALAPVARQQGRFVAKLLNAHLASAKAPPNFRYRDWGSLAVIGRSRAVASFGGLRLTGLLAWLAWALVHLALLVDVRSRLLVYINWTWAWIHRNRGVRLIIGPERRKAADHRPVD